MTTLLAGLALAGVVVLLVLTLLLLRRGGSNAVSAATVELVNQALHRVTTQLQGELGRTREEAAREAGRGREELAALLSSHRQESSQRLDRMLQTTEGRMENLRATVERRLELLQENNEKKLEQMRRTVDEKLQATLEQRLGESFRLVSERLEQVHKGLGEMRELAGGVGDLKRIMSNVRARGTWGEVQLGSLLEQILVAEQYDTNVAVLPGSAERVEFAIRLPGARQDEGAVWLPIDAKFPLEDYQRLTAAQDAGDAVAADEAGRALERRVRTEAAAIRSKYIQPPYTTDFALLYLPTEGLYAELLRRPGLADRLQREERVVLTGPMTIAAILNSLQMGFRTLEIEQRSSEVWRTLGAVKAEFSKFADTVDRVRKKIEAAGNEFDQVERRTRVINRALRSVEELPAEFGAELAAPEDD